MYKHFFKRVIDIIIGLIALPFVLLIIIIFDVRRNSYGVKPGVTGYAQAYFRNSITNEEKFRWDAYYAENISFWMDVKIIFQTFYSVIARKNINTEQSYKK